MEMLRRRRVPGAPPAVSMSLASPVWLWNLRTYTQVETGEEAEHWRIKSGGAGSKGN